MNNNNPSILDPIMYRKSIFALGAEDFTSDKDNQQIQKFLLELQLNNTDDRGSRRKDDIKLHADWIHNSFLSAKPARVLDLGCGPGFYSHYLAEKGSHCYGVDISPLAIAAAKAEAIGKDGCCEFVVGDILEVDFPAELDLIIMPYSIFNSFDEINNSKLLKKIAKSLKEDGTFYFEALKFSIPEEPYICRWHTSIDEDIFCSNSHLCLSEQFWNKEACTIIYRAYVIDTVKLVTNKFIFSQRLYTNEQYSSLLEACGFKDIYFPMHPPGTHKGDDVAYISIVAKKG